MSEVTICILFVSKYKDFGQKSNRSYFHSKFMPTARIDNDHYEKLQILAIWYKKELNLKGKFPITNVIGKLIEEWEKTHGKITKSLIIEK